MGAFHSGENLAHYNFKRFKMLKTASATSIALMTGALAS
jgi:hypothetical protein